MVPLMMLTTAPHLNHLDLMNAVVSLMMVVSVIPDTDASVSGIMCPKSSVSCSYHLHIMNAVLSMMILLVLCYTSVSITGAI